MTFQASIKLDLEKVVGTVDPWLYGANLEHFGETIYRGIWTEMLQSTKFSGPDPRLFEMAREDGRNPNHGVVIPWEAVNPDHQKVIFEHDRTVYYSGVQSQRITIRKDDGEPHGIYQRGLHLDAGREYQIRLILLGKGQPVTVKLGDQIWHISQVNSEWQPYTNILIPQASTPDGALTITFQGEHSLWVGVASVMPADSPDGFNHDLIEAMGVWGPTQLRWPGGNFASAYHWKDGIGDPDRRPAYFDPAFKLWEPNWVGTDEFVAFCRLVGSEPMITVNMGDSTPEEAAAWVEYCNGSVETKHGAMRAQNGHIEPYGLKTWYVGNEQFGNWQVGHCDPETYAHRYLAFAKAMRAVDPELTLIAVGVPSDLYGHWNERLLKIAGTKIDILSLHYYSIRTWRLENPPSPEELILPKLAASHDVKNMLEATLAVTAKFSDPPVPIAFDEWNTNTRGVPPLWIEDYNLADALYTAGVIHACIRHADRVRISAIYNLVNAMGCYRVSPTSVWKTPATLVMELLSQYRGSISLQCDVKSPTFEVEEIFCQLGYEDVPLVDAAATFDPQHACVFLSLTNHSLLEPVQISLEGIQPKGTARMYLITADHALIENSEENPDLVAITEQEISLNPPIFEIPPVSFVMLKIFMAGIV